jgi:hypothetical protein
VLAGVERVSEYRFHAEDEDLAVKQEPFLAELTRRHGWIQKFTNSHCFDLYHRRAPRRLFKSRSSSLYNLLNRAAAR